MIGLSHPPFSGMENTSIILLCLLPVTVEVQEIRMYVLWIGY